MSDFPSPLPLTAFEEYMLRDDRPTHPMIIIARLRFAGRLNQQAGTAALEQTIAPASSAACQDPANFGGTSGMGPGGRLSPFDPVARRPDIQSLACMRPIDLFSEPVLRVWAASNAQHSSLTIQVHHAACDGKAVLQVADDFLQSYARLVNRANTPTELSPYDGKALRKRGTFGLTAAKFCGCSPFSSRAY